MFHAESKRKEKGMHRSEGKQRLRSALLHHSEVGMEKEVMDTTVQASNIGKRMQWIH